MADPKPSTAPPAPVRRAAFGFVFVTILLDMIGIGLVIPVLPKLIESMAQGDTAQAARIFGYFGIAWAGIQLFASPLHGALSDRFGRRPVLLFSNLGLGLDYLLCALAPTLGWLFVGRVIAGICAATFSTATAYIADVTPPDQRAQTFGKVGAAFGIGFVLGPALGGLLGHADPRLPFWVAAGLSLANAAWGYFVLPESLPPDKRRSFAWVTAHPVGALRIYTNSRPLLALGAVHFLFHLAHMVLQTVFVLYASYRFGWTERDVGLSLAVVGVCAAVVQGGLVRPVIRRMGERATLLAGLAFGTIGLTLYGLAQTGAQLLTCIPVVSLWGLASAALMAMLSQHVSEREQGQLQGANSSLTSLSNLIAPGIFTQVFAWAIGGGAIGGGVVVGAAVARLPVTLATGTPFFLAAGFMLVALMIAWRETAERAETSSID